MVSFLDIRGDKAVFGEHRKFKPLIVPAQNDGFMISLKLPLIKRALGEKLDRTSVTLVMSDPSVLPKSMKGFQVLKGDDMGSKVQFPSEWLSVPFFVNSIAKSQENDRTTVPDTNFLTSFRALVRQQVPLGGLSAKDAAKLVHLNTRTLSRRLAKLGTTTAKEVSGAKIDYARKALDKSDRSAEEIAFDLGYSDPSNFSRAFAKAVGQSPSQYRARHRKSDIE